MKVGESKSGIGLLGSNKIMCSPEGGYHLFQRCVILDAQKQGLLKAKIKLLLNLYAWGMTTHHDLPS